MLGWLKHLAVSVVVMWVICSMAMAAEIERLSLAEAVALALANNPGLQAEYKKLDIGEARLLTAGRFPNPNLMSDNGIAEDTYRIGIQQTLELGGKRRKRKALAKAQMNVMSARVARQEQALRAKVRKAYSRYYWGREKYRILQERSLNYRVLLKTAQAQQSVTEPDPLETIEAAIIALSIEEQLQSAKLSVEEARNELSFLLGTALPAKAELTLPPNLSESLPDPERLVQIAIENRPDYFETLHKKEINQREAALAKARRIPNLTVAAGPDLVTGDPDRLEAFIMAQLEIPIFDRQQGPLLALKAQEEQLIYQQREKVGLIKMEVLNAWQACQANRRRIQTYETKLLPKANEIQNRALQRLERQEAPLLDVLSAQEVSLNTHLAFVRVLMDYQNSIAALELATGRRW